MANVYGPKITTDGLVLCLDKNNERSYLGEPFTNLTNTRSGGAMTSWSHGNGTYSSDERVTMNTPVGWEADKLILKQNGSDGWNGSPNLCRIYYGGNWVTSANIGYYYGCWIYTDNWSQFGTNGYNNVYKYVTGQAGWTPFQATGLEKVVDGLTWKWYANYINLPYSGTEYFVFFKNGSFTTDMVFYVAGAMCHSNGNRHIRWEDGSRSSTDGWKDISANGNHGDLSLLTYTSTKNPGTHTNSFIFDGADDKIAGLPDDLGYTTDVSVFAWYKKTSNTTGGGYHIVCGGHTALELSIYQNGNYLRNGVDTGGTRYVANQGSTLGNFDWHYVGLTYNSSTSVKTAYIDGVSVGTQTTNGGALTYSFTREIGGWASSYFLTGEIASYLVYDRALTDAEVLQNFNAHKGRYGL